LMTDNAETPKKGIRIGTLPGVLIILAMAVCAIVSVARFHERYSTVSNEPRAIATLRTMAYAQDQYSQKWERYGELAELASAGLIMKYLAEATSPGKAESGYYYLLKLTEDGWTAVALPAEPGKSGSRAFRIAEDGIIYFSSWKEVGDDPFRIGIMPLTPTP
jgi:hypothetical protein